MILKEARKYMRTGDLRLPAAVEICQKLIEALDGIYEAEGRRHD